MTEPDAQPATARFPETVRGVTVLTAVVLNPTCDGVPHYNRRGVAVVVEYARDVDPTSVAASMFVAMASYFDPAVPHELSPRDAPAIAAYVNHLPEMRDDRRPRPGRYVIVELDIRAQAGRGVSVRGSIALSRIPLLLRQSGEIRATDGELLSTGTTVLVPTSPARHLDTARFQHVTLENEDGNPVQVSYALPADLQPGQSYPLVVHVSGQAWLYLDRSNYAAYPTEDAYAPENNVGSSIACEGLAPWFANNAPPAIVASIQVRCEQSRGYDTEFTYDGHDGARDINTTVDHLCAMLPVDLARIYAVGNSAGGMLLSEAIYQEPRRFAAYLLVNGPLVHRGDDETLADYLDVIARDRLPLWMCRGLSDRGVERAQKPAEGLVRRYSDAGLSRGVIENLVRHSIYPDAEFHTLGTTNYHGAGVVLLTRYIAEVSAWMFAQRRTLTSAVSSAPR